MNILEWFEPTVAVGVTIAIFVLLQLRRDVPVDLLFLGGLITVTATGIITPREAFSGFANDGLLTIVALLAVTTSLRNCGVLDWMGERLLGNVQSERGALWRMAVTLVPGSSVLLNTALVAMTAPLVVEWCRRRNVSPSRLLIPVSYLTILGGVCTLIGTSTTLVVNAKLQQYTRASDERVVRLTERLEDAPAEPASRPPISAPDDAPAPNQAIGSETPRRDVPILPPLAEAHRNGAPNASPDAAAEGATRAAIQGELDQEQHRRRGIRPMPLLEITWIGIPVAAAGVAFLLILGPKLLPRRKDVVQDFGGKRREYLVEVVVSESCRLIGQSVGMGGLRNLPGLYLVEIDRDGDILTPVPPTSIIERGDRLVFTGVVRTIVDLEKIPGLIPVTEAEYEAEVQAQSGRPDERRHLTEVVLSRTSPLIGATIREGNFRQLYNAAVMAVHRNGVRLSNKLGSIRLEPGDTLLLQTRDDFVNLYRNSRDFYLVSSVEGYKPRRHDRAKIAAGITASLIAWLVVISLIPPIDAVRGLFSPPLAGAIAVLALVLTGCLRASDVRSAVDLQLLITIGAALGIGQALDNSGAASGLSMMLTGSVDSLPLSEAARPWVLLVVLYVLTAFLTELITNNAVAALMIPLAVGLAHAGGYEARPFVMGVCLAASLSFVTPIGYQTNLMVMGPGGYRPVDFVRIGLPLAIVCALVALPLIPLIWPFR